MTNYYLDIETTGVWATDKIITIQYQKLDTETSRPVGGLRILEEWVLGEKRMLEIFMRETGVLFNSFQFVPVGYNLSFEQDFLKRRSKFHGLQQIEILNKPHLDLHPFGVVMNSGHFKGSGLDKITGKKHNGSVIPHWYETKQYDNILNYITNEADEFLKFSERLHQIMPELKEKFLNIQHA